MWVKAQLSTSAGEGGELYAPCQDALGRSSWQWERRAGLKPQHSQCPLILCFLFGTVMDEDWPFLVSSWNNIIATFGNPKSQILRMSFKEIQNSKACQYSGSSCILKTALDKRLSAERWETHVRENPLCVLDSVSKILHSEMWVQRAYWSARFLC